MAERILSRIAWNKATLILEAIPGTASDMGIHLSRHVRSVAIPLGTHVPGMLTPPPADARLAFVGHLEERKGILDLIDSAHILAKRGISFTLDVYGSGSLETVVMNRIAERELGGHVRMRGRIDAGESIAAFQAAQIACIPSHGEPYGLVVLEAMAAGRPVIATDIGGPRYILDELGSKLVPIRSPQALASEIELTLRSPEWMHEAGMHNWTRARREFAWDVIGSQVLNEIEQL
ncbi:MAG: glycosyltransferase [Acidimicrobiia bacterium]|nr:glycosyltransferase [Acidimicrobiia bacterium]